MDFLEPEAVQKAYALMAQDHFLDGFVPFIRAAAEEHESSKGRHEGSGGATRQHVRFGCMWDLVMLWDEVDMETVRPNKKLEKELFANAAAGINFDKYDEVEVKVDGDNAPPPLTSVCNAQPYANAKIK